MKKIKMNLSKLQFDKEKITSLQDVDAQDLSGGFASGGFTGG